MNKKEETITKPSIAWIWWQKKTFLEVTGFLREIADDMVRGCPMDQGSNLFDDDWDRKYLHAGK